MPRPRESVKEQCPNAELFCLDQNITYTVCGWNMFDIDIRKSRAPRVLVIVFPQPRKQYLGKIKFTDLNLKGLNSPHHVVQGSSLVFGVWTAESGHLPSKLRIKSINSRSQQKGQGKICEPKSTLAWLKARNRQVTSCAGSIFRFEMQ